MSENYGISIGAGLLDVKYLEEADIRLYDIYERVLKHIESFRINANILENEESLIVKSLKPNNTISIIGDRGVGKTSLMLTLLDKLMWNNKKDGIKKQENIILPIVDPEKFNAEKNVLGWIIFHFKEIIDGFEEQNRDYCSEKKKDFEQLKEQHLKLQKIYVKSRESSRIEMAGFVSGSSEYVKISEDVIFADMSLDKELNKFINKFVAYIKKYISKDENPLIFITFDDIDLCPEQGVKIMNTILEYLAHPSIVTLVLGKLDNFKVGIENDLIKKLKVYNLSEEREINDKISKSTTNEILKKGLPPVLRNFIDELNYEGIMSFIPFANKKVYKTELRRHLEKIIINNETKLSMLDFFDRKTYIYFSNLNKVSLKEIFYSTFTLDSPAYYEQLLPKSRRGIVNLYFLISELVELKSLLEKKEINFEDFKFYVFSYFLSFINDDLNIQNTSKNYIKEIFFLDEKTKEVKITSRLESLLCYIGNKYEDFVVRVNYDFQEIHDEEYYMTIRNINNFLSVLKLSNVDPELLKLLEESNLIIKESVNRKKIFRENLLEIIFKILRDEEEYRIFKAYNFNMILKKTLESLIKESRNFYMVESSKNAIEAKNISNIIIKELDLLSKEIDDLSNYKLVLKNVEPKGSKEISERIIKIQTQMFELEKIEASYRRNENKKRREVGNKEREYFEALSLGDSSLKFYDNYKKTEIDEKVGIGIQFLIDIGKGLELIPKDTYTPSIRGILRYIGNNDKTMTNSINNLTFLDYYILVLKNKYFDNETKKNRKENFEKSKDFFINDLENRIKNRV